MEYRLDSGSGSVRLDVEGPDDVAPLLGFFGDELSKVSGRTREHRAAQVSETGLYLGVVESHVDLLVELVDDLGRRGPRCADAVPGSGPARIHPRWGCPAAPACGSRSLRPR